MTSEISDSAQIHGHSRVFDCNISKSNRVLGNSFLASTNLIENSSVYENHQPEEELER